MHRVQPFGLFALGALIGGMFTLGGFPLGCLVRHVLRSTEGDFAAASQHVIHMLPLKRFEAFPRFSILALLPLLSLARIEVSH